ncbi:MAG TPA: 50S ribosomal protein L30 [Nitrolancea sp.]|jgi:large subunit ribosomal protein L30|nr:50S ribosomal protein L30 [Nitrolancea sp.]
MSNGTIRITYFKSMIGYPKNQRETVHSLGFRRLNQTLEKTDNPSVRGMINTVRHLVRVEEPESE